MAKFSSTNQPKKHGRNPGRTVTDWMRLIAKSTVKGLNPITGVTEDLSGNQVVAIKLFQKIWQDDDLGAMREWLDRLEGRVTQKLVGEGFEQPIHNIINFNGNGKPNNSANSRVYGIDTPLADRSSEKV